MEPDWSHDRYSVSLFMLKSSQNIRVNPDIVEEVLLEKSLPETTGKMVFVKKVLGHTIGKPVPAQTLCLNEWQNRLQIPTPALGQTDDQAQTKKKQNKNLQSPRVNLTATRQV